MKQSPELQLIFSALQPNRGDIQLMITPNINWNLVYKLAIRHRVWHQVFAVLTPLNHETPTPVLERLAQKCRKDKMRILATAAETVRIAREFTEHNIQHCFIKGIVLNATVYDALDTRPCNDIDVWADANTYQQAIKLLISLGYQKKLPTYELKGFQERYYMSHKHDMAFYHPERKMLVELHFRLNYFGLDFFPFTPAMLKEIPIFNTQIMTLQDEYHLLYLMMHGSIHGWSRLRWLNDIALHIKRDKCELEHVLKLAKQLNCEHIVEQALILVQNNFGMKDPALAQLLIQPSKRGTKLAHLAHSFISSEYEQIEFRIHNKMLLKYRVYLVQLATTGNKYKALLGDLFKIDILFPYISFPNKLSFMYYVLYPFGVIKFFIFR